MTALQLWQRPVTYAAIGATQAEDLLQHPPAGYRAVERRARVGHGDARFDYAWTAVLSWQIQRNGGFEVREVDTPTQVSEGTYVPVSFDSGGTPVPPAVAGDEAVYGPSGSALAMPGDTVVLVGRLGFSAPTRVVYVIDQPRRKGFACGTLGGQPEHGEEAFIIEQTEEGSVWLTIRRFSRPAAWYWWAAYPVLRGVQEHFMRRYLVALARPID